MAAYANSDRHFVGFACPDELVTAGVNQNLVTEVSHHDVIVRVLANDGAT